MSRGLVLGVGNILMQDEGVGVRAVEWLQAHYVIPGVDMIDGGTMGLDLLHY
ncbi:MAG: hydrogenase maturation protease, partial [Caldilineae bacterium]